MYIFDFSIENGCQRHDCLPIANQGAEMAMVANFLQTSVQKFKARLHHFHASAADVSFFCTIGSITLLVRKNFLL